MAKQSERNTLQSAYYLKVNNNNNNCFLHNVAVWKGEVLYRSTKGIKLFP